MATDQVSVVVGCDFIPYVVWYETRQSWPRAFSSPQLGLELYRTGLYTTHQSVLEPFVSNHTIGSKNHTVDAALCPVKQRQYYIPVAHDLKVTWNDLA